MTGYIKNDAWHYENEVRLRVHFKHRRGLQGRRRGAIPRKAWWRK